MKALIRNDGETITEAYSHPFIDWSTGYPLTSEKWFGGPYTLVENYVPEVEEEPEEETPQEVVEDDDYVVIGGVRYSKNELRSLIE